MLSRPRGGEGPIAPAAFGDVGTRQATEVDVRLRDFAAKMPSLPGTAARTRMALSFLAGLLAAAVVAIGASSASAVIVQLKSGKTLSYQPLRSGGAAFRPFDSFFTNLDYNFGPVMSSNTNYAVYWQPSGAPAYPAEYQSGVNQFFEDLAADSGGHENVDSVATQYNELEGEFANYDSHFGGALIDTDPYPENGCEEASICLTDAQLQAELAKYITAHGLPADFNHAYFLLTPPGVEGCFDETEAECSAGAEINAFYCAYHSAFETEGQVVIYANDPYVTGNGGCDDGNHPNGKPSDGVIEGGLSHEHNESTTDPLPPFGWADLATGATTGSENGDKCRNFEPESEFGEPLGEVEVGGEKETYNQVINGHFYWYQQEWSNQGHECLQRFTFSGSEPSATFTATPGTGTELKFDASASTATGGVSRYRWGFINPATGSITEEESSSATIGHKFAKAGKQFVALTVFAEDGTSIASAGFVATGDESPSAAFSVGSTATAGTPVLFNASASTDPDGSIQAYEWNFGDGTRGLGVAPSHTYSAEGSYTVTLLVEDASEQFVTTSHTVVVDELPTAAFSVTTASPTAGQPVSFDGSASNDPDGTIVSYSWNFGDGSAAGSGATTSHVYAASGTYNVTLTVTDSSAVVNSVSHSLVVAGPGVAASPPPVAGGKIAASPNSTFTNLSASVNAKTGAITLTARISNAGSFRWLATFANGRFGVFAAAAKCRSGQIRLRGRCRPARITFSRGSRAFAAPGTVRISIKPSASALKALKNALKRRKGVPVTMRLTFRSALGGTPVTTTRSVTVKLKKR
jgi:PKD repeat protein